MNRKPPGLEITKAIQGFLQFNQAEGLSPRTIETYTHDLNQWSSYQGEIKVSKMTAQNRRAYIIYMQTEYRPEQIPGNKDIRLSPKTVRNTYISLGTFFHWAGDEFQGQPQ